MFCAVPTNIINGKAGISSVMALKLSKAFDNTPYLWLDMQNSYDLWKAQKSSREVKKVKALV